jgi:hypothetical protein
MDKNESAGRLPQHQPNTAEQALRLIDVCLALGWCPDHVNIFFYVFHLAHLPVIKALDEKSAGVVYGGRRFSLVAQAIGLTNGGLRRVRLRGNATSELQGKYRERQFAPASAKLAFS